MGWSRGFDLLSEIVGAYSALNPVVEKARAIEFWEKIIKSFLDNDADTLEDVLYFKPLPEGFEEAFYRVDPYSHGFRVSTEQDFPMENPWESGTPEHEKWKEGFEEGQ